MLSFVVGVIIFTCVHLIDHPVLSFFLGDKKQGDVRCEIFVLVAYLCTLSLTTFDNWTITTNLPNKYESAIDGPSFIARMGTSFLFVTISGILLASVFWGQGLTPDINNGTFAMLTIALISAWSLSCHYLFTGKHAVVRWIDNNLSPAVMKR